MKFTAQQVERLKELAANSVEISGYLHCALGLSPNDTDEATFILIECLACRIERMKLMLDKASSLA